MESGRPASNAKVFVPVLVSILLVDIITKRVAVAQLADQLRLPHAVIGDWLRMTLVYNPGAAFGLSVGEYSRPVFTILTIAALLILGRLYVTTRAGDSSRVIALAMVCGGALGNLLDRVVSSAGVIDFIDVGVGGARWPTFNVADIAVSIGAFLLAVVLWSEDRVVQPEFTPALATADASRESGDVS